MKMKKLLAILSVTAMITGLTAGCAGNKADAPKETAGEWDSSNDITIVSREDGSGTRGAFIELFGVQDEKDGKKIDMTTQEAQITNNTSVMMSTVAGDDYAVGYVSLGALKDTVKALKIDGVKATAENVKNGAYKISRPFNIAVKESLNNEVAKDFLAFIMSGQGQQIVEDNGYIAVDDSGDYAERGVSGKAVVGGSSSVAPVMEKLIEAYQEINSGAEIELQTTDSTTGMTSAVDGSYDIGMASRELKDSELSQGLEPQVIAVDGIAVIVNNNSAVEELGSEQVRAIYTGEVLTWDEAVK